MSAMKASVIIATYNRVESLRRCLAAIEGQTLAPMEVIVVDDASSDGTFQMVDVEFPTVRLLRQANNRGPAAARNRGIAVARGAIIAFTDDDCVPSPEWLAVLCAGFEERPGIVGIGGFQEAAEELIARNPVARAERVMRLQRWGTKVNGSQQGGIEVPGLGTNNVAYRREALRAVDGFDETFPVAAGEDTDLKVRIAQTVASWPDTAANGPFLYVPLKVRHEREYTLRAQWRMGVRRGVGAFHFECKHGRPPGLMRIFLRCTKRTLRFAIDLWRQPLQVALAIYLMRLGDGLGQLQSAVSYKRTLS